MTKCPQRYKDALGCCNAGASPLIASTEMLNSKLLSLFTLLPAVLAASPYSGAYIAARMDIKRAAPPTFFYNVHPNGNKKKCMQVRGGASVADNTVVEM